MKTNYHTHNYRCNHAKGTVLEYVLEALNAGLDEIGISDHLPHPGKDFASKSRMSYDDLNNYFNDIDEAIKIYGNKISIKKSIECEYFEEYQWLYDELREKYKVDYLILGAHFFPYKGEMTYIGKVDLTPELLEDYVNYVITSMDSGNFNYLAHPDLFGMQYLNWDEHSEKASRRILQKAQDLNIPLEININGLRRSTILYNKGERHPYPHKDFWSLSNEYDVDIIIGIDAHNPSEMNDLDMGHKFAKSLGISVIDRLIF
ncbi:histidinol-phosphatase [Clostridium gasigenes]|uniref:histidinol-phosphatase n=1 Tax=Clostridium gasigenes TaxID=94869 RepID=UPI001628CD1F|nr:histidinol-phosphatase [Clostridium gasigenes]MBB6622937.1 histidinol-phosphatase [Clostridium gasigenes]